MAPPPPRRGVSVFLSCTSLVSVGRCEGNSRFGRRNSRFSDKGIRRQAADFSRSGGGHATNIGAIPGSTGKTGNFGSHRNRGGFAEGGGLDLAQMAGDVVAGHLAHRRLLLGAACEGV